MNNNLRRSLRNNIHHSYRPIYFKLILRIFQKSNKDVLLSVVRWLHIVGRLQDNYNYLLEHSSEILLLTL